MECMPARPSPARKSPPLLSAVLFGAAVLIAVSPAFAAPITVPNYTFDSPTVPATGGGGALGGSYNVLNPGGQAWSVEGVGILGQLAAPTYSIGGGSATLSGITVLDLGILGGIVRTTASILNNNIGTTLTQNVTYRLTVDFTGNTTLSATLLNNAGFAIAILANGSAVQTSANNLVGNVGLSLNGTSGSLYIDYVATAATNNQNIGIALMTGRNNGLLNVNLLSSITFTEVRLSTVPEANASVLAGMGLCVLLAGRRFSRTVFPRKF